MSKLDDLIAERPIISTADVRAAGVHQLTINTAIENGKVFRVAPGLIVSPEIYVEPDLDLALACRRHGAVIGHLSAAIYHGLCDAIVDEREVFVPAHVSRSTRGMLHRYIRTRNPDALTLGVDTYDFHGMPIRITNRARTVVDLCRVDPVTNAQHATAAVVRYVTEEHPQDELKEIAEHFGAWDVIRRQVRIAEEVMRTGFEP